MTSIEGGGTYWWAVPSSLFMVVGAGITLSLLSIFVVVHSCCHLLLSIICCCPSFLLVCHVLLSRFASLALCLGMGEVDGGVVALVGCVCPVMAGGGCGWFSCALVVICRLLCPLCIFVTVVRQS